MENSSTGVKRKRSPAKTSPHKNVKDTESTAESSCSVEKAEAEDSVVKKELFQTVSSKLQETKKTAQGSVNTDSTSKGKKKKVGQQGKKSVKKKKNVKKKTFAKDEDDFEIDPRLGGTKIKQSISNKGKDKKLKSSDQEFKKNKTFEQRFPYIHIEGSWNVPNVVKIVNGHAKVLTLLLLQFTRFIPQFHFRRKMKLRARQQPN